MDLGQSYDIQTVLLPESSIDFFLKDEKTSSSVNDIQKDWRFARIKVSLLEGDIDSAIDTYKQTTSPSIVIIETEDTSQSFVEKLEALSQHCHERTSAIVIGPENDINLYRKLTSMGVSDYLVKPVSIETFQSVISKILIEKIGLSESKLISVVGAKGGVGTTTMAQSLSLGLSTILQQKTMALDLAGAWSSMGVGLCFDPLGKLSEAVKASEANDLDSLKRLLVEINDRLFVLASGAEETLEDSVSVSEFESLLNFIMPIYPYIVLDLSSANPSLKKIAFERSHQIIIVATPTLPSLRLTKSLLQDIKSLQGGSTENMDLIINMAGFSNDYEVKKQDIKTVLNFEPSLSVIFDSKTFMAVEMEGKTLDHFKMGQGYIEQIVKLLSRHIDISPYFSSENIPKDFLGKFKPFFKKRKIKKG